MNRTAWFERKFYFGSPAGMLPFYLERLEGTLLRIENKVKNVSEAILSEKLDGKWSVKQNIGHLAEVDETSLKRMDEFRQGISPLSPAVFEPTRDYNAQPINEVLKYFETIRRRKLEKFQTLTEDDLVKTSLHPRLKLMMNPVDLALFGAEHDDHHLVRIGEIISALKK